MTTHFDASVLIAGAGIGGLTTLLTMHHHGISATAIERTAELQAVGVGINLLPHAVQVLHQLGLKDGLEAISITPQHHDFYDDNGALLWREPLGVAGGYGYPQCSVHRGELQMLLLDAVADRIGADAVHTDTAVCGVDDLGDRVTVSTNRKPVTATVLVGADGIHSTVRAALHPDAADPLLYSGVRMYRGAATMAPYLDGETMAIVNTGRGVELVLYPLVGGLINWVLMVDEGHGVIANGDFGWDRPVHRPSLIAYVADWKLDWLDPVGLINATETITAFPMVDREPLSWWGRGRITLLGDAAHPMYPVGANGGSQAIVDAAVLAEALAERAGVEGLRGYERQRVPATAQVVLANRERHHSDSHRQGEAAQRYRARTRADDHTGPTGTTTARGAGADTY